jgi:hypothetical protein
VEGTLIKATAAIEEANPIAKSAITLFFNPVTRISCELNFFGV